MAQTITTIKEIHDNARDGKVSNMDIPAIYEKSLNQSIKRVKSHYLLDAALRIGSRDGDERGLGIIENANDAFDDGIDYNGDEIDAMKKEYVSERNAAKTFKKLKDEQDETAIITAWTNKAIAGDFGGAKADILTSTELDGKQKQGQLADLNTFITNLGKGKNYLKDRGSEERYAEAQNMFVDGTLTHAWINKYLGKEDGINTEDAKELRGLLDGKRKSLMQQPLTTQYFTTLKDMATPGKDDKAKVTLAAYGRATAQFLDYLQAYPDAVNDPKKLDDFWNSVIMPITLEQDIFTPLDFEQPERGVISRIWGDRWGYRYAKRTPTGRVGYLDWLTRQKVTVVNAPEPKTIEEFEEVQGILPTWEEAEQYRKKWEYKWQD